MVFIFKLQELFIIILIVTDFKICYYLNFTIYFVFMNQLVFINQFVCVNLRVFN
jgi:hypothetical protein